MIDALEIRFLIEENEIERERRIKGKHGELEMHFVILLLTLRVQEDKEHSSLPIIAGVRN